MNKTHSISIIIPVLNEAETILKLLNHLHKKSTTNAIKEIIVVDGNSVDGTQQLVTSNTFLKPVKLIVSRKGRATQMNVGAKNATGTILYFLHADSFPPNAFDKFILYKVNANQLAGCFKMKFNSNHFWLQLAGWLTQFNVKACRGGDQSLFITKTLFNTLNGFNEDYKIYEDYEFINKLYKLNEFTVIQHWLTTSARRYNIKGVWKLQYHFWAIYVKKWFGASAEELYRYYKKYIV